jgi:SPX domain protein involved in polyphosphate accumulation
MGGQPIADFRYERKFLVDQLDAHQVRAMVKRHPSMFYEPYPPRYVNNLYLDTKGMDNYFDNVNGVGERRKVRIRWYGDLFQDIEKPVLEFKFKRGLVGIKRTYPLAPFTLDHHFNDRYCQEILRQTELPANVMYTMLGLNVVLCNRYRRSYFATRDQRFRVTIDTEMTFYQVKRRNNRFVHRHTDHKQLIVELKYLEPMDMQAQRVAGFFPFNVTKNSKYVTGIERVFL